MTLGDSKTASGQWQPTLLNTLNSVSGEKWEWHNGGVAGATVASARASIATILAAIPYTSDPHVEVLTQWGANDVATNPVQVTWEADYLAIIDAVSAKWPQAKVRISLPWRRGFDAQCDTLATWIGNVVAARPGVAFVADDERDWLENGDNGATRTSDGVHPNAAGLVVESAVKLTAMGY